MSGVELLSALGRSHPETRVVLITGFGPYGVTPDNPAQLVAEELDGRTVAGATAAVRRRLL